MNKANNQELKSYYIQSSGIKISPYLLVIIALFVSVLSGLLAVNLELDAILVMGAIVGSLFLFLNSYYGLFVLVISFPLLVGFTSDVGLSEMVFTAFFSAWFLGWGARRLLDRSGKLDFGWYPLTKPALAIGALLAIAAAIGLLNGATLMYMFRDISQYVGYLIILPVVSVVSSRKTVWRLFIVVSLIGLLGFIWSSFIWWARKFGVEYSGDVAMIGSAYGGPIIGALWPLALLKTGRRIRLLAAFALLLLLFFTLGLGYRSRIISMLVMTCVAIWGIWAIQSGRQRMAVAVPLIIGAAFLFWFIGGVQGYLPLLGGDRTRELYVSLLSPGLLLQDVSIQGRLLEAQAALKLFREHPLFGQGLGHVVEFQWQLGWWKGSFSQHVWPSGMLMKFGVIGAFVFIWYFISIMRFTFTIAKKANNPVIKAITLGIFIWIFTNLVPTTGSLSNRGFTFMVGLMMGILPALAGWHPYAPEKTTAEDLLPRSQCRRFE